MAEPTSLAQGGELNEATWADFVSRLRHQTAGAGVKSHCTSEAVFLVQKKVQRLAPEGCGEQVAIFDGERSKSVELFFAGCSDEVQQQLNEYCDGNFIQAHNSLKSAAIEEHMSDYSLLHVTDEWETVNQHFTREAAQAFIDRKQHDYGILRIDVDSSYFCWEINAIRGAILSGRLILAS